MWCASPGSKVHSVSNTSLRHRGSPCHAWTSKPAAPTRKGNPRDLPLPQSTHYPILLLAFGNNPDWSLRIGLKGPERLDGRTTRLSSGAGQRKPTKRSRFLDLQAKDSATAAAVSVHLTREACTEAVSDPAAAPGPPQENTTFRVTGRSRSAWRDERLRPHRRRLFPKINNQPDAEDDADKTSHLHQPSPNSSLRRHGISESSWQRRAQSRRSQEKS